jgi:hypothetical protein
MRTNTSIFWAAILLVAAVAGGATGALITSYAVKSSPVAADKVLLIDSADPTATKTATLSSLAAAVVDWASPGVIGSTTPAAGTFTTITADGFDFGDPASGETGEIGLPEDPDNGTNTITLKAPANLAADIVLTLPSGVAPTTTTDACTAGQWWYATGYWYVCVATNTWRRAALSTW